MTTAEHVKIVNDVSLSQRPTLPAARDKARANGRQVEWWAGAQPLRRVDDELHAMGFAGRADWW